MNNQKFYMRNVYTNNKDRAINPLKIVCIYIPLFCEKCNHKLNVVLKNNKISWFSEIPCKHYSNELFVYRNRIVEEDKICKKVIQWI